MRVLRLFTFYSRWVLCANHMEPVKGFLGRYLRRKLLEHELRESGGTRNAEMAAVVEWLPRVWLHLNKFLETHSSSDVTIGKIATCRIAARKFLRRHERHEPF